MKNKFTLNIFLGSMLVFLSLCGFSQTGLEKVIVEKYYVSDPGDSVASIGVLPVGSVTYRIFLDMKPGYKFQTAYGSPTHTLFIKTTTGFFNNEDRGGVVPSYTKTQAKNNTVMLDSWLSAGAACVGNIAVLKSEDDGVSTVVNADNILANNDTSAGIPLTQQDGMISGTPGNVTMIGIDEQVNVFDAVSQEGSSFITTNGAWSCLNGATGADTTNKVLIGQFTTDGILSFELNIQLGTPEGGTEQFVAKDASGTETQFAGLTYTSPEHSSGIDDAAAQNSISAELSPNPAVNSCLVKVKAKNHYHLVSYTLHNLAGSEVRKGLLQSSGEEYLANISVDNLPSGIYFITLSLDGYKVTRKLIKN